MAADKRYGEGLVAEKNKAPVIPPSAIAAATTALAIPGLTVPAWLSVRTVAQWMFYGSGLMLILFLLLVFLHYTTYPIFSFGPNDDEGVIPLPAASNRQVAFVKGPAASDRTANFTNLLPFGVTYAMTLRLDGTVIGTLPRVLFYRAATSTPVSTGLAYPNSNVVLYLDPYVNDLYLQLTTASGSSSMRVIKNAPIGRPFRVAIVVQAKVVEVYLNGQLMETVLTPGGKDLTDIDPAYNVWGPPSTTGVSAKLAHLTYWPYVLSPRVIRLDTAESRDTSILS